MKRSSILAVLLLLALCLTGCFREDPAPTPPRYEPDPTPTAQTTEPTEFRETRDAKTQLDDIFAPVAQEDIVTPGQALAEEIAEQVSYTVLSEDEDQAVLEVTAPDFYGAFFDLYDPEGDDTVEDLLAQLQVELTESDRPMRTVQVTVPKENGAIVMTWELADALYGGLLTAMNELTAGYDQEVAS